MNERIKQLAKQTDELFAEDDPDFRPHWNQNFAWNKKFAELIVRECIEIVEPCKCGCNDGSEKIYTTLTDTAMLIKKHFGVEE